jgi:hypothetical protein
MRDRSSGRPSFKEKPSNVRILSVDILTFDGFFGAIFDILTPKRLPTDGLFKVKGRRQRVYANANLSVADRVRAAGSLVEQRAPSR